MRFTYLIYVLCFLIFSSTAYAQQRIVSASGNVSELIVELGYTDALVGVDTTSTRPADMMEALPKVGYRRNLSAEGILSLNPDLLILAPDAGPLNVIEQIKRAQVPVMTIQDDKDVDGLIEDIQLIANTLKVPEKAKAIIDKIRHEEQLIQQTRQSYHRQPKIAILMDGSTGRLSGLGGDTAGQGLLAIVGADNVFADQFTGVKAVSLEALMAEPADMIILSTFSKDKKVDTLTPANEHYPELALSHAGQNNCIFRIDAGQALGFGLQLTEAALQIAQRVNHCLP
ncbi:Hemin-binding periplasmic protein HmuT [Oligella sp. MSHR50489EDL]|uniref:heme/hemin ABC transporter substrate-binding protein n=1 Tax=Oligella sp. MSHR50489EDL TaxID=3139409 RepID=UPI003D81539E